MEEISFWKYIIKIRGTIYQRTQEPFIRLITIYLKDGVVSDVGITAKRERMKKARLVGICQERKIVHVEPKFRIKNEGEYEFQNGRFMLIYDLPRKNLEIFKTD